MAYELILGNRTVNVSDIFNKSTYVDLEVILKPMRDIFTFAERSGVITEQLSKKFNEELPRIK